MYTESATRKRTATLNAVTGRSASMIVEVVAGDTSVSHGDAASWRRNVVYAWMSTVLPVIQMRTCGVAVESVGLVADGGACPGTTPAAGETPVSHVYGGSALVIWSSTCGQIERSASMPRMMLIWEISESRIFSD